MIPEQHPQESDQSIQEAHHFTPFHQLIKGIGLNLCAWFIFTVMTDLIRLAQKDIHLAVIIFFQNLVGVLFILPIVLKYRSRTKRVRPMPWKLLTIRSVFGQLNMFLLFLAVNYTSLTDTMLFGNSAPIFIPIIGFFWLKHKIRSRIWPGILLGFVGIFLILKADHSSTEMNVGQLYALLAGVCLAVILISVRLLSLIEKKHIILFYMFLVGLIVFAPLAVLFWTHLTLESFGLLLGIGLLLVLGQFLLVKSFTYAETSQLSPFSYSVVIYSIILDWYFTSVKPSVMAVVGICLFCLGGIATIFLTHRTQKE